MTESYLFKNSKEVFRVIPFYELSINEWVVYENGIPKCLLNFNRRQLPLIQDLTIKLNKDEHLEDIILELGKFCGKKWNSYYNIIGTVIKGSEQTESIELLILDDLTEIEY